MGASLQKIFKMQQDAFTHLPGIEKKKISDLKGCIYSGLFAISLITMAGTQSPKMKLTTMLSEPILLSLNGESELQIQNY